MNRPQITEEMIAEAADEVAARVNGDAATIARYYMHPMDGYELARELDTYAGWDIKRGDVDELDSICRIVDQLLRKAEKEWAALTNPQPPLPIGTRVRKGVIAGIYQYSAARYLVKEDGCAQEGRFLLVKFEDAVAA